MPSVVAQNNQKLQKLWAQHNQINEEYLESQKVKDWVKNSLQEINILQNYEQSLTDLDGLIREYLVQVHQVSQQDLQNLALNYQQAIDFLKWLTDQRQEKENLQEQPQAKNQPIIEENKSQTLTSEVNAHDQSKSSPKPAKFQVLPEKQKVLQMQRIKEVQQHLNQFGDEVNTLVQSGNTPKIIKSKTNRNETQLQDQNNTVSPTQFTREQLSRKYKDYLKIIYEHYCKASYASGQDPTFQQIMHKTTVMTINKFMIFCKDFQLIKINQSVTRNFLIQIFKKHAECYKQMSFEQFCEVIRKLSIFVYGQGIKENRQQSNGQNENISDELLKILEFMQITNPRKFKQKMRKCNIQYRVGPKTNAELKVVPQGYRFKFTANNGKMQQQIKQQIHQRKQNRSQRKLQLRQKLSYNQNVTSLHRKKTQKYYQANIYSDKKTTNKDNSQSVHNINKVNTPNIPIPKKNTNVPPLPRQNQAITGYMPVSEQDNVFKKELSYAEMYKIKKIEGYGRKRANTNAKSNREGIFKLNSIVQQARQEVQYYAANYGPPTNSQNISDSIGTNSRQETQKLKMYDIHKINNKMQLINDKIAKKKEIHEELSGLLDISGQEDEYLKEHLQREKRQDIVGKRLSNRISQLQEV